MPSLGDLIGNLKLDVSNFIAGANSALNTWENLSGSLIKGGLILSGSVTAPLMKLGQSALSMGGMMTSAEVGFTTMLGSGEKAMDFLQELKDFAAATPFEFVDLVQAAKRMMALGFSTEEVIPNMTALGNAAAGLGGGAELINRLTLALGQMRAKGKVSAEEMRQLAEAGIPAWQMLGDSMNKSVGEVMAMAQKGALTAAQSIPVIIAGMNEKFGGLMENFSKTAIGQWSNLKDAMGFVLADIGKSLMPIASMILENFLIPMGEKLKALAEGFDKLSEPIKFLIVGMAALAAAVGPVMVAFGGLSFSLAQLAPLLGAEGVAGAVGALIPLLGYVVVAIAAVAAAWALWQLKPVQDAVRALGDALKNFWDNTLKPIGQAVIDFGTSFTTAAGKVVSSGFREVWDVLSRALSAVIDWLTKLGQAFSPLLPPIKELVGQLGTLAGLLIDSGWGILTAAVRAAWAAFKPLAEVAGGIVLVALQAVTAVVRDVLVPALTTVIGAVSSVIGWFQNLPKGLQSSIVVLGEVAAAVVVLIGVIAGVAGPFGALASGATLFAAVFDSVSFVIGAVVMGFGALQSALLSIIPAVTSAASSFATMAATSIAAAMGALKTFALTTVPQAISALSALAAAMLREAAASIMHFATVTIPAAITALVTFATTAIPAAISALVTFATTTVPAAIASMVTFATTAIPAAIASLTTFSATSVPGAITALLNLARTGVAAAVAAITTFATTIIPAAISALGTFAMTALPLVAVAAATAAAAFAGWKLGQWINENVISSIPWLDKLADTIMGPVASAVAWMTGATKGQKAAQESFAASVAALEQKLKAQGVTVERGAMSLEEYSRALLDAAKSTATAHAATESQVVSLATAKAALDKAKEAYDVVNAAMLKGGATQRELATAQANLTSAQNAYNTALDVAGLSIPKVRAALLAARTEVAAAAANLKTARQEYDKTNISADALAAAQFRVRDANLKLDAANKLAKQSAAALGTDVASLTRGLGENTTAAALTKEEAKKLEAQIKRNSDAFQANKKAALEHVLALQASKRYSEEYGRYLITGLIPVSGAAKEAAEAVEGAYYDMDTAMKKVMADAPGLSDSLKRMLDQVTTAGFSAANALGKAYETLGIKTTESFRATAIASEEAYAEIVQDGSSGAYEVLQGWVKMAEDEKALTLRMKGDWKDYQEANLQKAKDTLGKMEGATKDSADKQKSIWKEWGNQVSTIISDSAKSITEGLWKLLRGVNSNAELDKQTADLKRSLDQRKVEYDQYVTDIAEAEGKLREDYQSYLDKELDELKDNLGDKTDEYNRFVNDAAESAEKLRRDSAASLKRELDDLRESLADRLAEYDRYRRDVNKSMERKAEDLQDSLSDEKRDLDRSIADKKTDYDRDVRNLQDRINRELAKGADANQEDIADWRQRIRDKKTDLDTFIARAIEDYNEFVSDANVEYQRDVDDYNTSLADKKSDLDAFIAENKTKQDEVTTANKLALDRELADLEQNLADKTAEYEAYKASIATQQGEIAIAAKLRLDEDLANLQQNLIDKKSEYDQYVADTNAKLQEIKDQHVTVWGAIKDFIVGEGGILDQIGQGLVRILIEGQLKKLYDSLWNLIAESGPLKALEGAFSSLFSKIGGWIGDAIGALTGLGSKAAGVAGSLLGVGGGTASVIGGEGLDVIGETVAAGAGTASKVTGTIASTVSSIANPINMVSGIVSAVGSVAGAIGTMRLEGTMNAVELNTRYIKIYFDQPGGVLDYLNRIWDPVSNMRAYFPSWDDKLFALYELRDIAKFDLKPWLASSLSALGDIVTGGPRDVNITVNAAGTTTEMASIISEAIAVQLRLEFGTP